MNPTSIYKDAGLTPGPDQWVKDLVLPRAVTDEAWISSCCGCWLRPAAEAPIQPLAWEAWELPYATCAALKKAKKKERETETETKTEIERIKRNEYTFLLILL